MAEDQREGGRLLRRDGGGHPLFLQLQSRLESDASPERALEKKVNTILHLCYPMFLSICSLQSSPFEAS